VSNQSSDYSPARRIVWQSGVQPPGTQGVPNQSSSFRKFSGIQTVREVDGSPSIEASILEVDNGTLSEPSPGVARITTSGGTSSIRFREFDGSPDVGTVDDVIVPNNTIVSVAGNTIRLSFREDVDYAGSFELASSPSTGDIPAGKWGWWWDTTRSKLFLVRNQGGALHYVEATC
jgi:hypothetical protein